MPPRTVLDMDQLLEKWVALGDKTSPKGTQKPHPKRIRSTKKAPTAAERVVKTEQDIETKKKNELELSVLAPTSMFKESTPEPEVPVIDPNTLCPYCDLPFPEFPTPLLVQLMVDAFIKSRADPRPDNCLGRWVDMSIRATVCSRHEFEMELMPEAANQGWPTDIDFDDVDRRLRVHKHVFKELIGDWNCVPDVPRARSVFWEAAVQNITENSSKSQGIAGNITNFDNIQPGYYGERGVEVIQETFNRLLQIPNELTHPLSPNQFCAFVLTPEAGVLLIMEDRYLSRNDAIQMMRASSSYGAQMFPSFVD
ncbi:hypothetical protein B0H11DRAFT_1878583 [Mycena galericulata]|nr:hypothetical protein B0H11DRAFT_1878583 [Mycena galericulata]